MVNIIVTKCENKDIRIIMVKTIRNISKKKVTIKKPHKGWAQNWGTDCGTKLAANMGTRNTDENQRVKRKLCKVRTKTGQHCYGLKVDENVAHLNNIITINKKISLQLMKAKQTGRQISFLGLMAKCRMQGFLKSVFSRKREKPWRRFGRSLVPTA